MWGDSADWALPQEAKIDNATIARDAIDFGGTGIGEIYVLRMWGEHPVGTERDSRHILIDIGARTRIARDLIVD